MMPVKELPDERPLLPEVIERLGFGLAQVRAGLVGGGVYFADGAELLLISAVTNAVAQQWGMSPLQKGLVVTLVFVGIAVGNFASGPIADAYGRRQLILASFCGIFFFSILSSMTVNCATLSVVRFFVGAAFGLGQPAWSTLGAEITPADWRVGMQGISQGFFVLGEVYSTVLLMVDDPTLKHLHWRWLLRMGAIPAAVFLVLGLFLLHQSPSFLAVAGRCNEAKAVLGSMRHDNSAHNVPVDFRMATSVNQLPRSLRRNSRRISLQSRGELRRQLRGIFGQDLWLSTLIVMYSCFVLNFLYYGCLYAFPQVLSESSATEGGTALELLIGALWELPGQALGILLGFWLPRKLNMKVYLWLSGASVLAFALSNAHGTRAAAIVQKLGYYGIKCFTDVGFVVVYQYSIEIYPTKVRTTGTALAVGSGRLGGIISPLIFELIHSSGSSAAFFYILLGLCAANFFMVDLLKYETQGTMLKDEMEEGDGQEAEEERGESSALLPGATTASPIVPEPFTLGR